MRRERDRRRRLSLPRPADIEFARRGKRFGEVIAVDGVDLRVARGLVLHLSRAVGLRQDHVAAPDRGLRAAERRRRAGRRPLDAGRAALPPAGEHGVPALRAVPASRCRGQHRLRAEAAGAAPRCAALARQVDAMLELVRLPGYGRVGSGSCPAASSSGWRWHARWSTGRRCSCSTSLWRPSTASCGATCRSNCRTCSTRSASPSSWSPTTRRRRCR